MDRAKEISDALHRAGIDKLSPLARSHLANRIAAHLSGGDFDGRNIAGLRDVTFGSSKNGSPRLATFRDIDAGARAAVSNAFRAAPRNWSDTDETTLSRLGTYPINRKSPVPVGDVLDVAKKAILTPHAIVEDVLFGPSAEAEATFRGLIADWEGYERIFSKTDILSKLPELRDDLVEWRKFRDEWRAGSIPGNEHGGRLNVQVALSNKVRRLLKEQNVIDPALAQERSGVDVEKSSVALATAAKVEKEVKKIPLLELLTRPGQDTIDTPFGPFPKNITIAVGVGLGISGLLALAYTIRAVRG